MNGTHAADRTTGASSRWRYSSALPIDALLTRGVAAGLTGGLAFILVKLFFPWFVDPRGPNQILELIVHPLAYGLVLVPFFLSVVHRQHER